jgi:hypothetical protein
MKGKFSSVRNSVVAAAALCGALASAGAAAQQVHAQSSAYTTYTTPSVTVRVHWSTQQEVEQRCGKDAAGCASPANAEKGYAEIWAQKPAGWDDYDAICYLGGIVLRIVDAGTSRTNTAEARVEATPQMQTVLR